MPTPEDLISNLQNLPAAAVLGSLEAEMERRRKMPQSPAALGELISRGQYKRPKHIEVLDQKLVALAKGEIKRLIVTMPPRHGKSETCSKYFPAWYLGTYPDRRIILCSAAESLASDFGGYVRNIMLEHGKPIFGVSVDEGSQAKNNWKIANRNGGMIASGVGGQIQGKGAFLFVVDDPFRSEREASSKLIRDNLWKWWMTDAYSRLEPQGSVLVIHTRFHQDDFIGRLLRKDSDDMIQEVQDQPWHLINFPAIAEEEDALGRKVGEALWPDRFPIDILKQRRVGMSNYVWASMWQQRPAPDSGEVFKREWFRYYRKEGDIYRLMRPDSDEPAYSVSAAKCTRIAVMDVASSEEQTADYTVLMVVDITPSYDAIVVDMWRSRSQSPDVISAAAAMCRRYNVTSLGVEKNGVGLGVYQILRRKSITVRPLHAKGDKKTRTRVAAQARMQAGMIYFDPNAAYTADIESELLDFPKGAHDDTVDAIAWMAIWVQDLGGPPREVADDVYDKQLDTQDEPSNRIGDLVKEEVLATAVPQDGLSDEARSWLRGEMLGWLKPSRN